MVTFARGMEIADGDWWLTELRHDWGTAYRFLLYAALWSAERRDNGRTLTAGSACELLTAVRDDYAENPVPR